MRFLILISCLTLVVSELYVLEAGATPQYALVDLGARSSSLLGGYWTPGAERQYGSVIAQIGGPAHAYMWSGSAASALDFHPTALNKRNSEVEGGAPTSGGGELLVGWAMADHRRTDLCLDALNMAQQSRKPLADLLHHSDRGVQYASADYRLVLQSHDIAVSMSRVGNCYDNAAMESFWGTLKTELVHHRKYRTREEARQSIFKYIACWYNRKRHHSALGYKSPEQFEASLN